MEAEPADRESGDLSFFFWILLGIWGAFSLLCWILPTRSGMGVGVESIAYGVGLTALVLPSLVLLYFRDPGPLWWEVVTAILGWAPIGLIVVVIVNTLMDSYGVPLPEHLTLVPPRAAVHLTIAGLTLAGLALARWKVRSKLVSTSEAPAWS